MPHLHDHSLDSRSPPLKQSHHHSASESSDLERRAGFEDNGNRHAHHEDAGERLMERLGETVGNLANRDNTTGHIFRGIASFLDDIGKNEKR